MNEMIPATRARPVRLAAVAVCIALLAACTGVDGGADPGPTGTVGPSASSTSESASPTPSPSPSPSSSPSPTPTDSFAVPDEITPQYVERVMNEIARIDAEIAREVLQSPVDEDASQLPADLDQRLEDLDAEPILEFRRRQLVDLLRSPDERKELLPPAEYGQLRYSVEQVLTTEPCILARVTRDFSETDAVADTESTSVSFAFLSGSENANPTGWKLARLLTSDAQRGSSEEGELRSVSAEELANQTPEVCS